jgi:hypothetical protein
MGALAYHILYNNITSDRISTLLAIDFEVILVRIVENHTNFAGNKDQAIEEGAGSLMWLSKLNHTPFWTSAR